MVHSYNRIVIDGYKLLTDK